MRFHIKNNMPIILSEKLCKFASKFLGFLVGGITLFPFIIVRDENILNDKYYINHESIHIRQYIETLIIGVILIGLIKYIYYRLILKKSRIESYYLMSHEQEAHQNDHNLDYLKTRKWFSYYKYLNPKNKKKMDLVDGERVIYQFIK